MMSIFGDEIMFVIKYEIGNSVQTLTYKNTDEYVARQQLEVPDVEDYYRLESVTLDGQPLSGFDGKTTGELFDFLLAQKK